MLPIDNEGNLNRPNLPSLELLVGPELPEDMDGEDVELVICGVAVETVGRGRSFLWRG